MKKVLITGIDSFTGKHLSSYLSSHGYDVYGTSLFFNDNKIYQCDITKMPDIMDVLTAVEPDFVIHLSGISFAAHGNSEDFYKVNTIGSINLLDSFIRLGQHPDKIILASSATVYGNQGLEVLDESLCPKPTNHYGASKWAMESLAHNYYDRLPIIITRPFNYTGIGQEEHFLIPKIVKHYKEHKTIIELGNLDVSREFNSVEYVCEVYERLLECEHKGEVVNISSDTGIKLLDVIKIMNDIVDYDIEVRVNPDFVRKGEIKKLTGSTEKLFSMIGNIKQKDFKMIVEDMYND